MPESSEILLTLGAVLLAGLATDALGRLTPLPRVTLLLLFGFVVGPETLDLLPPQFVDSFDLIASMALLMIGFLLGGQFTAKTLREHGRDILSVSIMVVLVTAVVVFFSLLAAGVPPALAVLLAGLAPATDPAATVDVVRESNSTGRFTRTLLGVVAIDDAWGLMLFSVMMAVAGLLAGANGGSSTLATAGWEAGGAILLGLVLGLPAAHLTGRVEPGEPTLVEALGLVFLCGGLALWLNVSYLIAAMVLGMVIVNLAKHHSRPFHAIENIEWPFSVLFFVLAGASLRLDALQAMGGIALTYAVSRIAGRVFGGWLGGVLGRMPPPGRNWVGVALMPQAGVAVGMALVAAEAYPALGGQLLTLAVASTVFFELTGPILTRYAIHRVQLVEQRPPTVGEPPGHAS